LPNQHFFQLFSPIVVVSEAPTIFSTLISLWLAKTAAFFGELYHAQ